MIGTTGQPALLSFSNMVQQSPQLLFSGAQAAFPFLNAEGLLIVGSAVEMPPGDSSREYSHYEFEVLTLNSDQSYGDYYSSYYSDAGGYAAAQMEMLSLAAANGPPVVWIEGWPFMETLEYSPWVDDGAVAYDAVDGFIPITSTTYQLCSIPESMQAGLHTYMDAYDYNYPLAFTQLDCFKVSSSLDTYIAGNLSQVSSVCIQGANSEYECTRDSRM